jgi:hypothetical protein
MEHRTKHRVLRTVYLILVVILFTMIVTSLFNRFTDGYVALLIGFIIGLILFLIYESLVIKEMKKHKNLYLNSATQIYIGAIALTSAIVTLVLYFVFNTPIETGLAEMSILTMIFLIVTIKPFDRFLEKRGH